MAKKQRLSMLVVVALLVGVCLIGALTTAPKLYYAYRRRVAYATLPAPPLMPSPSVRGYVQRASRPFSVAVATATKPAWEYDRPAGPEERPSWMYARPAGPMNIPLPAPIVA
jgi:hypothetical protein